MRLSCNSHFNLFSFSWTNKTFWEKSKYFTVFNSHLKKRKVIKIVKKYAYKWITIITIIYLYNLYLTSTLYCTSIPSQYSCVNWTNPCIQCDDKFLKWNPICCTLPTQHTPSNKTVSGASTSTRSCDVGRDVVVGKVRVVGDNWTGGRSQNDVWVWSSKLSFTLALSKWTGLLNKWAVDGVWLCTLPFLSRLRGRPWANDLSVLLVRRWDVEESLELSLLKFTAEWSIVSCGVPVYNGVYLRLVTFDVSTDCTFGIWGEPSNPIGGEEWGVSSSDVCEGELSFACNVVSLTVKWDKLVITLLSTGVVGLTKVLLSRGIKDCLIVGTTGIWATVGSEIIGILIVVVLVGDGGSGTCIFDEGGSDIGIIEDKGTDEFTWQVRDWISGTCSCADEGSEIGTSKDTSWGKGSEANICGDEGSGEDTWGDIGSETSTIWEDGPVTGIFWEGSKCEDKGSTTWEKDASFSGDAWSVSSCDGVVSTFCKILDDTETLCDNDKGVRPVGGVIWELEFLSVERNDSTSNRVASRVALIWASLVADLVRGDGIEGERLGEEGLCSSGGGGGEGDSAGEDEAEDE